MAPPRILFVEDDGALRDAVRAALAAEGYEVEAVETGAHLDRHLHHFRPDLVLLDVRLPGPDGFALGRRVRAESDAAVLFVTAADALEDRLAGFDLGADDYVTKPFSMAELMARVRAVLRRAGRLESDIWQVGDLVIDAGAHVVTRHGEPVDLTPTEFNLLLALARNGDRPISKERLLASVWQFDSYDTNLVEVHVSGIRRKLEALGPRLIHTVRGIGYVLRP